MGFKVWSLHTKVERLKTISVIFTIIEGLELLRVFLTTSWENVWKPPYSPGNRLFEFADTNTWDKFNVAEMVLIALLFITNIFLFKGANKRNVNMFLPFLYLFGLAILTMTCVLLYYIVDVSFVFTPHLRNEWMGLPRLMQPHSPVFQQTRRYKLETSLVKLIILLIVTPFSAICWMMVYKDRKHILFNTTVINPTMFLMHIVGHVGNMRSLNFDPNPVLQKKLHKQTRFVEVD